MILIQKYLIIWIILLGLFLRLYGINWDQNQHLHPDERFLTMVVGSMQLPSVLSEYFDPQISKLNPNNIGYSFYVYGNLPLVFIKIAARLANFDNYNGITLLGRFFSSIFDTATIILIFLIAKLFEKKYRSNKSIKYFAAFFYAIAISPIQHGHFFVVDSFLVFFASAAVYFSLRFNFKCLKINLILSALFFSIAVACKINAILFIPLIGLLLVDFKLIRKKKAGFITNNTINFVLFSFTFYLTLRIISPFYFETSNWLNFKIKTNSMKFYFSLSPYSLNIYSTTAFASLGFNPWSGITG